MPSKATLIVSCPQCAGEHQWDSNNQFRPFCSERCKLIDLGKWANEEYRVAQAADNDDHEFIPPDHQA